jgi:5-methylcytosine-specific restriction endonuclease McrA
MSLLSSDDQVLFLTRLQRLFAEGSFVDTYKFALIRALADISVEKGSGDVEPLTITVKELAEKFIQYYWGQALPFGQEQDKLGVLAQNPGKQAAVINSILFAQESGSASLARVKNERSTWNSLVHDVRQTVKVMPLWKLQVLGGKVEEFLYTNTGEGDEVVLLPGVAYNFRKFYSFIQDMVQGAWLRHIRRIKENGRYIGRDLDLREFLFGTERANLAPYHELLMQIQRGGCFYCGGTIGKSAEVDHFIPWVKYPHDLGHNFVLTDADCNRSKRDFLAADNHLAKWFERNEIHHNDMSLYFEEKGIVYDLAASRQITCWAYDQAEITGANVWVEGDEFKPIGKAWRNMCG